MYTTVCLECQLAGAADHLDPESIITDRQDFCEIGDHA